MSETLGWSLQTPPDRCVIKNAAQVVLGKKEQQQSSSTSCSLFNEFRGTNLKNQAAGNQRGRRLKWETAESFLQMSRLNR